MEKVQTLGTIYSICVLKLWELDAYHASFDFLRLRK
jgi:hypothetical protein